MRMARMPPCERFACLDTNGSYRAVRVDLSYLDFGEPVERVPFGGIAGFLRRLSAQGKRFEDGCCGRQLAACKLSTTATNTAPPEYLARTTSCPITASNNLLHTCCLPQQPKPRRRNTPPTKTSSPAAANDSLPPASCLPQQVTPCRWNTPLAKQADPRSERQHTTCKLPSTPSNSAPLEYTARKASSSTAASDSSSPTNGSPSEQQLATGKPPSAASNTAPPEYTARKTSSSTVASDSTPHASCPLRQVIPCRQNAPPAKQAAPPQRATAPRPQVASRTNQHPATGIYCPQKQAAPSQLAAASRPQVTFRSNQHRGAGIHRSQSKQARRS